MSAQDFLSKYGELKDANAHFINAGNTVVKPVAELLEEYAASRQPATDKPAAAAKRTSKKK